MTRHSPAFELPGSVSVQRAWSGILNVDKPSGLTSHDVVALVRRASHQGQVGHAGTLDPMATGVLLVCLGKGTRISEYLMASPKTYRAAIHLGITTTTDDAEGDVVAQSPVEVPYTEIRRAVLQFVGRIDQTPPAYSALKRGGQRLYKLARRGQVPELLPRPVEIFELQIEQWTPPVLYVQVRCGPGTYIRSLARDLGRSLGCGAHLALLRRTTSGQFSVEQAISPQQMEDAFASGAIAELLCPIDTAVADLPALYLDTATCLRLMAGQPIAGNESAVSEGSLARVYTPDRQFIAIVAWDADMAKWRPRKVFAQAGDPLAVGGESPC
jgi:tRNA pseudouridine55 synthase